MKKIVYRQTFGQNVRIKNSQVGCSVFLKLEQVSSRKFTQNITISTTAISELFRNRMAFNVFVLTKPPVSLSASFSQHFFYFCFFCLQVVGVKRMESKERKRTGREQG